MSGFPHTTEPRQKPTERGGFTVCGYTKHKASRISGGLPETHNGIGITFLDNLNFLNCGAYINASRINIVEQFTVVLGLTFACASYLAGFYNKLQTSNNSNKNAEQNRRAAFSDDSTTEHELYEQYEFVQPAVKNRIELFELKAICNSELDLEYLLFGHSLFPFICCLSAEAAAPAYQDGESRYLRTLSLLLWVDSYAACFLVEGGVANLPQNHAPGMVKTRHFFPVISMF
ncbi:hypothetical protein ACU61T_20475 [Klebsiella aerogenes]